MKPEKNNTKTDLSEIFINTIIESKTNQRKNFDLKELRELAESIKAKGVIQPLLLRPLGKKFEIVFGARRLRAAQIAGLKTVPAMVKDLSDEDAYDIQLIENIQRKDIHPYEEAEGFQYLIKNKNYDVKAIAERIGKSIQYVYLRLNLLNLITEFSELFKIGELSYAQVKDISRLSSDMQKKCYEDNFDNTYLELSEIGPNRIKGWIAHNNDKRLEKAPFDLSDGALLSEAGACVNCQCNSSFAQELFPELAKEKICTRPECYNIKIQKFLEKRKEKFTQKNIDVLEVSNSYQGEKYPHIDNFQECKKNDAEAKPAIIMDSYNEKDIGRIVYLKERKFGNSGTGSTRNNFNEKFEEARRKNNNIVRAEALRYFTNKILSDLKSNNLPVDVKRTLLKITYSHIDHDTSAKIKSLMEWDISKYKKEGYIDYEKFYTEIFINKADVSEGTLFYIFFGLLISKVFCLSAYDSYNDKFRKEMNPDGFNIDYILELSKIYEFDYEGKLKELNEASKIKLKEKLSKGKKDKTNKKP